MLLLVLGICSKAPESKPVKLETSCRVISVQWASTLTTIFLHHHRHTASDSLLCHRDGIYLSLHPRNQCDQIKIAKCL